MYNGQNGELHYRNGIALPRICWYFNFDNNHSVYVSVSYLEVSLLRCITITRLSIDTLQSINIGLPIWILIKLPSSGARQRHVWRALALMGGYEPIAVNVLHKE